MMSSPEPSVPERDGQKLTTLCVDLDGTLTGTDLFVEAYLRLLMAKPLKALLALTRLSAGRAVLKEYLAAHVSTRPELLPYREEVLEHIRRARGEGRKVVLVTASHQRFAEQVADHLKLFDAVHGTSLERNLKGEAKAQFLRENYAPFEYIGDSMADTAVWGAADQVTVVPSSRRVRTHAQQNYSGARIFQGGIGWQHIPRLLRVHQWVKNLLLFIPLVMGHQFGSLDTWSAAFLGFLLFSMTASAVYILNDLADLENDREHPSKRERPIAAGKIAPQTALLIVDRKSVV